MRKTLLILLVAAISMTAMAQEDVIPSEFNESIQTFAEGVASSLPLIAAVGLNWSDAYIGQFPHFGVGGAVGFGTIPFDAARPVLQAMQLEDVVVNSPVFQYLEQYGMPVPAYSAEARLGGFFIPFDAGVRVGILPPDWSPESLLQGLNLDYRMFGFDVRFPIVQERGVLPDISISGGYTRLNATIGLSGIYGSDVQLASYSVPGVDPIDIVLTDPSAEFFWEANVIDLKAQVSKNLLLFTPYAGFGASLGFGRAGGGFEADLSGIDQAAIDEFNAAAEQLGQDAIVLPEFVDGGFYVSAPMTGGWAFRAFGGVSINLLVVKLDLTAMYDFIGLNFGATVGLRVQL